MITCPECGATFDDWVDRTWVQYGCDTCRKYWDDAASDDSKCFDATHQLWGPNYITKKVCPECKVARD